MARPIREKRYRIFTDTRGRVLRRRRFVAKPTLARIVVLGMADGVERANFRESMWNLAQSMFAANDDMPRIVNLS